MDPSRRQVLRGAGVGFGAVAFGSMIGAPARAAIGGTEAASAVVPEARSYDFNPDWKFVLVNPDGVTDPAGAYTNAYQPGFDDSKWRALDLPHDWSIELTPVDNGGTISGNGFFQGGLGWYRKTFILPGHMTGKRVSVEFDGVYSNSNVYINGQLLGNHPYAYTGFNYDLTGKVHTDGRTPNVIAVQASNQIPSSRWYSGSGIYRNVHLIVTSPVHVARHGTFVTTPDLETTLGSGFANANTQTIIQNDGGSTASAKVTVTVRDPHGAVAGSASATVDVAAGQTATATSTVRVSHPRLWSTEQPALYDLETAVETSGAIVDVTHSTFGIRHFSFDPAAGFSLNGHHMKIQGVDLHATQGPLGAVILPGALARQMRIMKSMGVNALRTAHNPPAPELTAVCEQLGIVMMVEAFDCWHTGKLPFDYHLYFDQWSDSDIREMVNAHKNSPAVVLWSIGNETPDTGLPGGPSIAKRLVADVKAIDTTRPVVMGSDRYRGVPKTGSPPDLIVRELDGLGVNYNTAKSMDGLHAAYPGKFFFCSETSSETSTRGFYQDPDLLNTGENYTPGKRNTSSYDNNLASWTMSGEYELKKDRDRLFWAGGFLWSGQDYIGEPTPYDVFPVKASFFGAVDTAGFAKDAYHLFRSQWSAEPAVHIVPMDWTSWAPGEPVSVWVYANVATVELFLNGRSLGSKSFDRKVTTFGQPYLETTEPTHDDDNYPSGSYTSPNGSAGKLHLAWTVPFAPGTLTAVALDSPGGPGGGQPPGQGYTAVARDTVATAGPARAIALSPDVRTLAADGYGVSFVTATVVDSHGTVVPSAEDVLTFRVEGPGWLAGTDNGREENAAGYQVAPVPAWRGKAVGVVRAGRRAGPVTVTVTSPGLAAATVRLEAVPARGAAAIGTSTGQPAPISGRSAESAGTSGPTADASYSGAPTTIPAMMLDGNLATGWSNHYVKAATANLPAVSVSNASDWVSLSWPAPQRLSSVVAAFTTGGPLALPETIAVTYWDGHDFVPVPDLKIAWASASNQPTTLTFGAVTTTQIRLTMTSPSPGSGTGFLMIAELKAA
ncbi:MAG TPA: glycoside hydrolase family 2 TIM barrel-domain containing protein [Streptosporangiaceae bacterium]